jgi:hypothetical protein
MAVPRPANARSPHLGSGAADWIGGAVTQDRQMRLGVFVQVPGHHVGGWRHPDAVTTGWPNLGLMQHIAATAERAKFDMFFLGDGFATATASIPRPSASSSR